MLLTFTSWNKKVNKTTAEQLSTAEQLPKVRTVHSEQQVANTFNYNRSTNK